MSSFSFHKPDEGLYHQISRDTGGGRKRMGGGGKREREKKKTARNVVSHMSRPGCSSFFRKPGGPGKRKGKGGKKNYGPDHKPEPARQVWFQGSGTV